MDDSSFSSLDDLSVLDPSQLTELQQTTPTINIYSDGRLSVKITTNSDDDEDDLSKYLQVPPRDDERELSPQETPSTLSPSSDSPPLSPAALTPVPLESLSSDLNLNVKHRRGGKKRNLPEDSDETWQSIISGTIKEEIRCKIQLRRINMGQEELKVEFSQPEPTISYDVVKRRNEIRQKNKEYAKQSRERVKQERQRLEQDYRKLTQLNKKLLQYTTNLKEKLTTSENSLIHHRTTCPVCSKMRYDRSIYPISTMTLEPSPTIKQTKAVTKQSLGLLEPRPSLVESSLQNTEQSSTVLTPISNSKAPVLYLKPGPSRSFRAVRTRISSTSSSSSSSSSSMSLAE